jgi:hypothetical protein
MSDLYDSDILVWSEQQAALLRRLATGERITHEVDWENVVEEIESVGRNDLHAVNSYLALTLLQMLKPRGWPNAPYVPHWQGEARRFRGEAIDRCSPSLRQRLDLAKIYRRALQALPPTIDGQPPLPLPQSCPVSLDELLRDE